MKCFSCGNDKDLSVEVVYPYPEDGSLCDSPIPQLLTIECQGRDNKGYRMVAMCHNCWHKLETNRGIDMWIGEDCWESLNPVMPFANLPLVRDDLDNIEKWSAKNILGHVGTDHEV